MQIANVLAGYSLGEADLLRRAMGKKNPEEMAKQRNRFVQGAIERKHPKEKVIRIFDLMEQFAGYGFNKSHSAAYALLAYHTAYLKTHHPVEFMAALLSSEISKPENVVKYIKECREMGIAVEPPDVQISGADFTPSASGIRFGLTAIKNVGRNAIDSILIARAALAEEKRGFDTFWEFCEKVDLRLMNKRVLESLVKSGALDSLGRRSQLMAVSDRAMERAQQAQRDLVAGQHGLFAGLASAFDQGSNGTKSADDLPNTPDWDENQRLQSEKEVLGFFVSGHPLDKYAEKLRNLNVIDTATALEMKASPPPAGRRRDGPPENLLAIAGVIVGLKIRSKIPSARSISFVSPRTIRGFARASRLRCRSWSRVRFARMTKSRRPSSPFPACSHWRTSGSSCPRTSGSVCRWKMRAKPCSAHCAP